MKVSRYFSWIILFSIIFYSCGGESNNSDNSSNSNNSSLNKCEGKQAYIRYTFEGESTVDIPVDKMDAVAIYSEYAEIAKSSSFIADFYAGEIKSNLMLIGNTYNFKKGRYEFPDEDDPSKGAITLALDDGTNPAIWQALSGELKIEEWSYIAKGRRENTIKDFAKGTYNGIFKSMLDFQNQSTAKIKIDFCSCGEIRD